MTKTLMKRMVTTILSLIMAAGFVISGAFATTLKVEAADSKTAKAIKAEFDADFYANQYPDVKAAFGTNKNALLNHFMKYGMKEGRMMNANFDPMAYTAAYPDIKAICKPTDYTKAYEHYVTYGKKEGRTLTTNTAINKKKAAEAPKLTSTRYQIDLSHDLSVSVSESQYRSCTIKIYKSNDGYGAYIDGYCYDTSGNFNSDSCYHYSTVSVNNGNWSENVHSQPQQQKAQPAPTPAPAPAPQPDPTPEPDDDEDLTDEDTAALYTLLLMAFLSEYDELDEKHNSGELNDAEFEAAVAALRAEYGIYE